MCHFDTDKLLQPSKAMTQTSKDLVLTQTLVCDLGAGVRKRLCDTPSSDDARTLCVKFDYIILNGPELLPTQNKLYVPYAQRLYHDTSVLC